MRAIDDAAALIRGAERVAIATHVAPDPDAIGSLLALGHGLNLLGKETLLLCDDPVPEKLRFLPGSDMVMTAVTPGFFPNLFVGVDASDRERLGSVARGHLSGEIPILNIDHHITNLNFGTVNLVVPESAATCEAMLLLFHALNVPLTVEISTCLMAGLVGDTRSFSTSSTTANTLEVAARLVYVGADIATITDSVFNRRSVNVLRLWGIGLSALELDGDILWTAVRITDRAEAGILETHDSGLANILLSASEANVAIVFTEQNPNLIDVSFRARPGHDVAKTALALGGGGHSLAAGCQMVSNLTDAITTVLAALRASRSTSNSLVDIQS